MSKPLSDEALLVAKALKNFDPEKYNYMRPGCCLAGQYYGASGSDWDNPLNEKWWELSYIAAKEHGITPEGNCNGHIIDFRDGKALKEALYKTYGLAEVK